MPRGLSAVLVLAAACGGSSSRVADSPKWTEAVATQPAASTPACIPHVEDGTQIAAASADGNVISYCLGTESPNCFAYDVGTKQFTRLTERPAPKSRSSAYVLTVTPALDVCAAECKSLAPQVLPGLSSIRAATNAAGSVAIFLLGDAPSGKGYAEIWDVPKGKRVTSFKYARGDFKCGDVAMLGETIYLSTSTCKQPAARAALYTTKGRKIANVGSADFGAFGNAYVELDATTWAFLEENATELVVQDVVKGKVKKTIALGPLFDGAGAAMGDPGESALVKLANGRLVVILGAPATGSLGLVEVETGAVEVVRPPVCGP